MSSKSSNTGGQTGGCSTNTRGFAAETRQFATSGQGSPGDKAGRMLLMHPFIAIQDRIIVLMQIE